MFKLLIFCTIYSLVPNWSLSLTCKLKERIWNKRKSCFHLVRPRNEDSFDYCRFLYSGDPTYEKEANQKPYKELEPKHVHWSPFIPCREIHRWLNTYGNYSFWIWNPVPELGEDIYEIENCYNNQLLMIRGKDRGLDPEQYVKNDERLVFMENRNTSSFYRDVASLWRICSPEEGYWYFKNFVNSEYLYLR